MVEVMRQAMKKLTPYILLLAMAEIVASATVWHGTPTDWNGVHLGFWSFESSRLLYWCGFCLLFVGLWGAAWIVFRRSSGAAIRVILGLVCSLGIEMLTSIYFWKGLSSNQTGYLGWPALHRYVLEHSIPWAVVVLLGIGYAVFRYKNRHSQQSAL
jgi:hypothetical protein